MTGASLSLQRPTRLKLPCICHIKEYLIHNDGQLIAKLWDDIKQRSDMVVELVREHKEMENEAHLIDKIQTIAVELQATSDRIDYWQGLITSMISLCDEYCMLTEEEEVGERNNESPKRAFIEAIIKYVDAKIEYELVSIEEDEEGYRGTCVAERKEMEVAKKCLIECVE
jgi:hypothetical protein